MRGSESTNNLDSLLTNALRAYVSLWSAIRSSRGFNLPDRVKERSLNPLRILARRLQVGLPDVARRAPYPASLFFSAVDAMCLTAPAFTKHRSGQRDCTPQLYGTVFHTKPTQLSRPPARIEQAALLQTFGLPSCGFSPMHAAGAGSSDWKYGSRIWKRPSLPVWWNGLVPLLLCPRSSADSRHQRS